MPVDIGKIHSEIVGGLRNEWGEHSAQEDRRKNALYMDGIFEEVTVREKPFNVERESIRTSLLFKRVVQLLTANLYRSGPTRTLQGHDAASKWLESVYAENDADALWQEADRLSMGTDVAAFEVFPNEGEDRDERPIGLNLWGGEQLATWCDPDDARKPGAVAVVDQYDGRRRLRLWTPTQCGVYYTAPGSGTAGGTAYTRDGAFEANPYGCLPFAFYHATFPAREFWSGGPGNSLREMNYHLNCRLTRAADEVRNNTPLPVVENAPPGFSFPKDRKPGEWVKIDAEQTAGGDIGGSVRASYVTCDLGYLAGNWSDLTSYLEHALEMLGIPYSALRMEQMTAASGISLVAEQIPIILWAQSRQRPASSYERQLARVVLKVAAAHAEATGTRLDGVTTTQLQAASKARLSLRWPEMGVELPGADRDTSDEWLVTNQLMSRLELLMKRFNLSREEATVKAAQIADDEDLWDALFGPGDQAGEPDGAEPPADDGGEPAPAPAPAPEPDADDADPLGEAA